MLGLNKESIPIVFLRYIEDLDIANAQTEMDWDSIVSLFQDVKRTSNKRSVPGFIPAKLKPSTERQANERGSERIDENIEQISIAVLDLDKPGGLEEAKKAFSEFDYIIHSTHSYNSEQPYKFRMLLRLEKPIANDMWKEFFYKIASPISADLSCSNASRGYYLPSHAPDAGLEPYFESNKGRPLSLEDADEIAARHEKKLKKDQNVRELRKFQARIGETPGVEGRRHFASGEIVKQNSLSKVIDCSYQGYKERHAGLIEELKMTDSRHDFAKEVVWKELYDSRENIDIPSMVLFIHRAAIDESSKPLFGAKGGKVGNTEDELFELIESAYRKISRRQPINRDLPSLLGNFDQVLEEARSQAIVYYRTKDEAALNFPGKIDNRERKQRNVTEFDNEQMKTRHTMAIKEYMETSKWSRFAYRVLTSENALQDGEQMYHCINFILHATDKLHQTHFKRSIDAHNFKRAAFALSDKLVDIDAGCKTMLESIPEDERKEKANELKRKLKFTFSSGMAKMKSIEPQPSSLSA